MCKLGRRRLRLQEERPSEGLDKHLEESIAAVEIREAHLTRVCNHKYAYTATAKHLISERETDQVVLLRSGRKDTENGTGARG